MSTLNELSVAAELAQAVYSNLQVGPIDPAWLREEANSNLNTIAAPNMSQAQAADVANRYTVEAVFNDTGTGTYTGAYAVLFKDKATQKLTLAVRGTDQLLWDSFTANGYLLAGIPPFLNPQFRALRPAVAQWIQDGKIPAGSAIAGHSLGGYLGAALKDAFPSTFGSVVTLNAPGFALALGPAWQAAASRLAANTHAWLVDALSSPLAAPSAAALLIDDDERLGAKLVPATARIKLSSGVDSRLGVCA